MNILIAGASGAVGRMLVPRLVQAGHTVTGTTHRPENIQVIESLGAKALVADAFDRDATFAAVREASPEVVIHQLTSLGSRVFAENSRIRVEGTRHLVDAAREAGVKRIIVQSIAWAYQPGNGPATENVPLDVESADPSRKRTVDAVAALEETAAEIPEHVILRYGLFYGPGTWYKAAGIWPKSCVRDECLPMKEFPHSYMWRTPPMPHAKRWIGRPVLIILWMMSRHGAPIGSRFLQSRSVFPCSTQLQVRGSLGNVVRQMPKPAGWGGNRCTPLGEPVFKGVIKAYEGHECTAYQTLDSPGLFRCYKGCFFVWGKPAVFLLDSHLYVRV